MSYTPTNLNFPSARPFTRVTGRSKATPFPGKRTPTKHYGGFFNWFRYIFQKMTKHHIFFVIFLAFTAMSLM